MTIVIRHIQTLVHTETKPALKFSGEEMSRPVHLNNAFLIIKDGLIHSFGIDDSAVIEKFLSADSGTTVINAKGKVVFPSFCDAHTHLVWAGSREKEFVDRINGLSYQEIALRGGGILNSVARLRKTSEEEL